MDNFRRITLGAVCTLCASLGLAQGDSSQIKSPTTMSAQELRSQQIVLEPTRAIPGLTLILVDMTKSPPVISLIQDKWYQKSQVSTLRPGQAIRLSPGRHLGIAVLSQKDPAKTEELPSAALLADRIEADQSHTSVPLKGESYAWFDKRALAKSSKEQFDRVSDAHGSFVLFQHESFLVVPETGTLALGVANTEENAQSALQDGSNGVRFVIAPAERWEFDDTFSPYFTFASGQKPKFAAVNTPLVFGDNHRLRLDAVAAFDLDGNEHFLGQALSYSMYIGTTYKESGNGFFRFPVRITFSIGLQEWSFDEKSFGSGRPFIGFGITIPAGNAG